MEYSWAGELWAAGDQSDGARDVSAPTLGAQGRAVDVSRIIGLAANAGGYDIAFWFLFCLARTYRTLFFISIWMSLGYGRLFLFLFVKLYSGAR
jgi:hypothetical protein